MLAVVVALFFINDFAFIAADTASQWLAADYLFKAVALAIIVLYGPLRGAARDQPLSVSLAEATLLVLATTALIITIFETVYPAIEMIFPKTALQELPEIHSSALFWFDLSIGLTLTALAEELVFRRLFYGVLRQYFISTTLFVLSSAVLFGLIHWSGGFANVISSTIAGIALMALMLRTGSVIPPIIVHFIANFVLFYDPP